MTAFRPARFPLPALLLALSLAAPGSQAQPADSAATPAGALSDLSLDALLDMPVTGASRFVQRRSQASSSVSVISRAELLALGHHTLADVLASVRGTMISSDRTYHYIGVRGAYVPGDYNTRVLVLIDGNRVNDSMYDQGFLGSEFALDLAQVERVEFVAGQGSAVYGANALFGVVNLITREAARQAEASAGLALGSDGERILRAGLRLPLAGGGLQIAASQLRRRGADVFDAGQVQPGSDGWSRGTDGERRDALYLRWDQGAFTASLLHADRRKGIPVVLGLVYGDPTNRYRDTYSLLNLEYSQALGSASTLTTRGFVGAYRFVGDYAIDYPPLSVNRDYSLVQWQGVEGRITSTALALHRLVAGIELQRTPTLTQANDDLAPSPVNYLRDQRSAWRGALYAEDQWTLAPQWALHLGWRLDRVKGQAAQSSPRLALLWQPDAWWTLKAIHGQAFRPPNAYESYYRADAPGGYATNPALRAERVRGSELVAEWQPQPAWRLSGSLYQNHTQGLLQVGYDAGIDRFRFDNTGVLDNRGIELEVEHVADSLRWRANYSRNSARSVQDAALALYPTQMLKATAVLPLRADWTLGLELGALSRRGAAPGQASAHLTLRGPLLALPGLRLGAAAGSTPGPVLSLALRNLANRALQDPGADLQRQPVLPLPGRSWRLALDWALEP